MQTCPAGDCGCSAWTRQTECLGHILFPPSNMVNLTTNMVNLHLWQYRAARRKVALDFISSPAFKELLDLQTLGSDEAWPYFWKSFTCWFLSTSHKLWTVGNSVGNSLIFLHLSSFCDRRICNERAPQARFYDVFHGRNMTIMALRLKDHVHALYNIW